MSDEDSDYFERETLIDNHLLHTEYQEVNQEFRHRNQLLQNTFYLLIIAAGVFLGLFIQFGLDASLMTLGGLTIASGVVATIIGHLFLKHFHERSSAEVVRMHAEWIANGERRKAKRALSLEWGVAGGGAFYDKENNRIVKRGSHLHYITKLPKRFPSAEFFGFVLIYLGGLFLVLGVTVSSFSITTGLLPWFIGGFTAALILIVYSFARTRAESPSDKPIY